MFRTVSLLSSLILCLLPSTTSCADDESTKPKRVLLLSQAPDGHPAGTHEYHAGMRVLATCLKYVPGVQVKHVHADGDWPEGPELIRDADGVVLFVSEGAKWIHQDPRRLAAFAELAGRGGGFVCLHWGMGARDAKYIDGFLKLFGGCHGGPDRKYKVVDTELSVAQTDHPVTFGIGDIKLHEEFYYKLKFVDAGDNLKPVLKAEIDGTVETVAWAWQRGDGGRSFGFSGGHFHENWKREEYRRVMSQAVLWTLAIPVPKHGLDVKIDAAVIELD
ncbi:MAG: hypothetical protein CMJ64_07530 [Planctomycetaceae bacterium]|nr:hypothetical protein [Planctomycetaceae bacterium]